MARRKDTQPILYEMMYILDPELGEDGIERMNSVLRERVIREGGLIEKDQPWGIRRLAYEIKKRQEGYYHLLEFRAPPALPSALAPFIRTQIGILRYLIIKVSKARILQEERDAAAAARRAAAAKVAEEKRLAKAAESLKADESADVDVPDGTASPADKVSTQETPIASTSVLSEGTPFSFSDIPSKEETPAASDTIEEEQPPAEPKTDTLGEEETKVSEEQNKPQEMSEGDQEKVSEPTDSSEPTSDSPST